MSAYYNEVDPYAAQWLRNLIAANLIAPGDVDERSIVDVQPDDLAGYEQCHFFAGIGVWSYALRLAGWPDARPVWTGSCPCQPFSAAGKGGGFSDARHLWPAWFRLIRERRPVAIFGEQVASRDALAWLDNVCTDLEGEGYTVGAIDSCAAGYGAPHIRQRLYWVADADEGRPIHPIQAGWGGVGIASTTDGMANADCDRAARHAGEEESAREPCRTNADDCGGMGETKHARPQRFERSCDMALRGGSGAHGSTATAGFWRDAEWLPCRDGKARPVEPGTSPLVAGTPGRMGRLRAYGNCIVAPQAAEFVRAYMNAVL